MWKFINTSVIGSSHLHDNKPCQDYNLVEEVYINKEKYLIALVSDGAGSAKKSEIGSKVTCQRMRSFIKTCLKFKRPLNKEDVEIWVKSLRKILNKLAERKSLSLNDFACTIVGAILGKEQNIFFQIGDGAIVISSQTEAELEVVFWPKTGDYINTTYFVTERNALSHLEVKIVNTPINTIALFSDGLQNLALSFAQQKVHTPFFKPMFEQLKKYPAQKIRDLKNPLEYFLNSNSVNERTDDDKTLVLAVR